MKFRLCLIATLFAASQISPLLYAQGITGGAPTQQESVVEQPVNAPQSQGPQLTLEEQLKIRAAQRKAAEDPAVRAALAKRDQAIEDFRKALHDAMVKVDPKLEPTLQKISIGNSPGF